MDYLWKDRKRTFLGLPWSFTKYALSNDRLFIETGFFSTKYEEIRLYRILDFELIQTFGQKILGVGTINVVSSDKTMKDFSIKNVKKPKDVKELLSERVESERDRKRVFNREILNAPFDDHDHDGLNSTPDDMDDDYEHDEQMDGYINDSETQD